MKVIHLWKNVSLHILYPASVECYIVCRWEDVSWKCANETVNKFGLEVETFEWSLSFECVWLKLQVFYT